MTINQPNIPGTMLPAGPPGGQGIQGTQGIQGQQGTSGPQGVGGATGPAPYATPITYTSGINAVVGPPATAVINSGTVYLCTVAHVTGASIDLTKWQAIPSTVAGVNSLNGGTGTLSVVAAGGGSIALSGSNVLISEPGGMINKFRNGTFPVAQRGTSGSVALNTAATTLDGWYVSALGAACSWSQQYNQNLAGYALRLACATGLTTSNIFQRIESNIAAQLLTPTKGARAITIQFTIYNNSGASITPVLSVQCASAQDNFTGTISDLGNTNLQTIPNGMAATVCYTYTTSVPASVGLGYQVILSFGGSLNAASGYIDIGFADIRATPGLSTGLNSNPPPIELRPNWIESHFCRRYYQTSYDNGVAPGTATHNGMVSSGINNNTAAGIVFVPFPVAMRAAPALSYWDGVGNASKASADQSTIGTYTDNLAVTTMAPSAATTRGFMCGAQSTNTTYLYHYAASAEL